MVGLARVDDFISLDIWAAVIYFDVGDRLCGRLDFRLGSAIGQAVGTRLVCWTCQCLGRFFIELAGVSRFPESTCIATCEEGVFEVIEAVAACLGVLI